MKDVPVYQLGQSRLCCINEHWKRPWCWERLKAGGEGDDREWDGWVASPTEFWANSERWTGKDREARHAVVCGVSESDMTEALNNSSSNEQLSYFHDFSQKSLFLTPGMTEAFSSQSPRDLSWWTLHLDMCFHHHKGRKRGWGDLCTLSWRLLLGSDTCPDVYVSLIEASNLARSNFRQTGKSVVLWV